MANDYIVANFKPLYIPFDYSFPPCKEYVPPVPINPLQVITTEIEQDLPLNDAAKLPE